LVTRAIGLAAKQKTKDSKCRNENQNSFKNFSHQQDGEKQLDIRTVGVA
jgi:hypothetical protein